MLSAKATQLASLKGRSFFYEIFPFGEFQLPPTLFSMADVASAPLLAARSDCD